MNKIAIFKALSNETRLNILTWLKEPCKYFAGQCNDVETYGVCVGSIERKAGLSQSTISQYLSLLQQAGLITMERSGQWTFCRLNEKTIKELIGELKHEFL